MSQEEGPPGPEPQLLVGIDWATKTHVVCALSPDGKVRRKFTVPHSPAGFARLVAELLKLCPDPRAIAVAIEDPHHPLVDWLLDQQLQVFALNPKQLDRFRDRHSVAGAKDDKKDSYVLADALRTDRHKFTPLAIPDPVQLAIRETSRCYDTLQKEFNRYTNRLQGLLRRSAPQLLELCPGADEPFFFEVLQLAPTQDAARALRPARLAALLKKHAKRKLTASQVLAALRAPRLPLAPGAQEALRTTVAAFLPILLVTWRQMTDARARLHELCPKAGRTAQILDSFPGVAEVVCGAFLAEAPHALASRNLPQLRALGGTAPVTMRSGQTIAVHMRRACNRRLRDALFHWSTTAIVHDPRARAHYQQLIAAGQKHPRALRGVADRLLARLVAALATDTLYRPLIPSQESAAA